MLTIQKNIPLAPLTTFKIGGPAKFFCVAKDKSELLEALDFAKENKLEIFMLGGGSNVLFSDKGFDGLVIKMQSSEVSEPSFAKATAGKQDAKIECWAGESLASVVNFTKENSLMGMEWAVGIPGTVGGAVRGNAGAPWGCMADSIESVRGINLENQESIDYSREDCKFSYRDSVFKKDKNLLILSCILKMQKGERDMIEKRMQEISKTRSDNQPKGLSSGSFFQNPVVSDKNLIAEFEKDTGKKIEENKSLYKQERGEIKLPAGWLIEEAGFKGKKIGGVMVSEKHANFFINDGTGTAEDVVILAGIIKQKIREEFDTQIKEEIIYVGF
ncbi:MAG: UDP-N-acetylmuramate dehydrogenase [Candidatus Moraniibacteriota bacterium]